MIIKTQKLIIAVTAVALVVGGVLLFRLQRQVQQKSKVELTVTTDSILVPANTLTSDPAGGYMTAKRSFADLTVPEDGWLTYFRPVSVNGAPESALRYQFVLDTSQKDPQCPESLRLVLELPVEPWPQTTFPSGYGYFVSGGTRLRIVGGFANFSQEDYPSASLTASVGFVPKSRGLHLKSVYPLLLNAECSSLFFVPPRATNFAKSLLKPFIVPFDGRIINIGTHAHHFATEILLTLNGNEVWRTSPIHLPDGSNLGNPVYLAPLKGLPVKKGDALNLVAGIPVKKGDALNLIVTYSNPLDEPVDAMAQSYIQIIPDQE